MNPAKNSFYDQVIRHQCLPQKACNSDSDKYKSTSLGASWEEFESNELNLYNEGFCHPIPKKVQGNPTQKFENVIVKSKKKLHTMVENTYIQGLHTEKIFAKGFGTGDTEEKILRNFSQYGTIGRLLIPKGGVEKRGFCYIIMATKQDHESIMKGKKRVQYSGKITLELAHGKKNKMAKTAKGCGSYTPYIVSNRSHLNLKKKCVHGPINQHKSNYRFNIMDGVFSSVLEVASPFGTLVLANSSQNYQKAVALGVFGKENELNQVFQMEKRDLSAQYELGLQKSGQNVNMLHSVPICLEGNSHQTTGL